MRSFLSYDASDILKADMKTCPTNKNIEGLVAAVSLNRWAECPSFLTAELGATLRQEAHDMEASGGFRPATIVGGHGKADTAIRGDQIVWFDKHTAQPGQLAYLAVMEELRLELNGALLLGAFDFECHFAVYPPGTFYRRHVDRPHGKAQRVLSCIAYLNPDWKAVHGGELRIFSGDTAEDPYVDIAPLGCTLVCFLSEGLFHEVRPTMVDRYAITGWFRTREQ